MEKHRHGKKFTWSPPEKGFNTIMSILKSYPRLIDSSKIKITDITEGSKSMISITHRLCKKTIRVSINTLINTGKACSNCSSDVSNYYTENKLHKYLLTLDDKVVFQPKFDWCRNPRTKRHLPFDFLVHKKVLLELDGKQHFEQVLNWSPPEMTQIRDQYKADQCIKNGYSIIRLYQPDVYTDSFDWKLPLKQEIDRLFRTGKPEKVFIEDPSNPTRYSHFT